MLSILFASHTASFGVYEPKKRAFQWYHKIRTALCLCCFCWSAFFAWYLRTLSLTRFSLLASITAHIDPNLPRKTKRRRSSNGCFYVEIIDKKIFGRWTLGLVIIFFFRFISFCFVLDPKEKKFTCTDSIGQEWEAKKRTVIRLLKCFSAGPHRASPERTMLIGETFSYFISHFHSIWEGERQNVHHLGQTLHVVTQ